MTERTVTIMYRNSYEGGDGWTYYPLTIAIAPTCPVCGGPRGEPVMRRFCNDGDWYDLDTWENPCGHLDMYKDVYAEARQRIQGEGKDAHETETRPARPS